MLCQSVSSCFTNIFLSTYLTLPMHPVACHTKVVPSSYLILWYVMHGSFLLSHTAHVSSACHTNVVPSSYLILWHVMHVILQWFIPLITYFPCIQWNVIPTLFLPLISYCGMSCMLYHSGSFLLSHMHQVACHTCHTNVAPSSYQFAHLCNVNDKLFHLDTSQSIQSSVLEKPLKHKTI